MDSVEQSEISDRIVQDPAILAGKPVIKGTRISVEVVLDYLAINPEFDEFLADYPQLTMDDVKACLSFAHALVTKVPRKRQNGPKLQRSDSASDIPNVEKGAITSTTPADAHELWERVRLLEGRKLNSTSGRSTFEILSVKSDVALIRIHSTGSERSIRRQEFDKALKFGMVTFSVTPSQIRESGASEFSPAYVAAIIRTVLGQNL